MALPLPSSPHWAPTSTIAGIGVHLLSGTSPGQAPGRRERLREAACSWSRTRPPVGPDDEQVDAALAVLRAAADVRRRGVRRARRPGPAARPPRRPHARRRRRRRRLHPAVATLHPRGELAATGRSGSCRSAPATTWPARSTSRSTRRTRPGPASPAGRGRSTCRRRRRRGRRQRRARRDRRGGRRAGRRAQGPARAGGLRRRQRRGRAGATGWQLRVEVDGRSSHATARR